MARIARVELAVSVLKQGNHYVAYAPALDLSTSGRSEREAKKRFAEAAAIFIKELERAGTTREVLRELGWKRERKQWVPPLVVSQNIMGLRLPVPPAYRSS